jgi:hypothetical protein
MVTLESNCVDCGRPERCGSCKLHKYTPHYYCDICGHLLDEDNHYIVNNQDYCEECLLNEFKRRYE